MNNHAVIENFFKAYEVGANTFDPDLIYSQYSKEFMGGGPDGVVVGKNEDFRQAMPARKKLFETIGFKKATILKLTQTWLDDHYVLAKVHWQMDFQKKDGTEVKATFYDTYCLYVHEGKAKVVFFISHEDEQKVMKKLGLLS